MTDDRRQRLSALLDGESSPAELKQTLAETLLDPELTACWERYHTIGRVLRGEHVSASARHIAAGVAQRLAEEPVPRPQASAPPAPLPQAAARRRAAAAGPIVGGALAAGLAMITVVVGPRIGGYTGHPDAPAVAERAPVNIDPGTPVAVERWAVDKPVVASKLNELLVSHRERSAATGLGGLMPYAALVSYGGSR